MAKPPPYARIAITLPPETLAAADRLARAADRSRSWVIAEAVRRFAATGLGPSRTGQLQRDLQLTPEARVRAAEETMRVAELRHGPRRDRMLAFDRYEDFLDWKRSEDTRG
jgi:metal-responsive CopG/Arc/MetJ family transcriptional regulator